MSNYCTIGTDIMSCDTLCFREHDIKQREAEVKLASKLISEEEQFKRRKKMYPHLWQEKKWVDNLVCTVNISFLSLDIKFISDHIYVL